MVYFQKSWVSLKFWVQLYTFKPKFLEQGIFNENNNNKKQTKRCLETSGIMTKSYFILNPLPQTQLDQIILNLDKALSTKHRLHVKNVKKKNIFCVLKGKKKGPKSSL